jgi:hypothetical protein
MVEMPEAARVGDSPPLKAITVADDRAVTVRPATKTVPKLR